MATTLRHASAALRRRPLLLAASLIALLLRLLWLESVPPGLHPDEARNLLDAASIAATGHDSRGFWMPMTFDHFGVDEVEGLHVYAMALSSWLLGPSPFSARLPAALAGALGVLILSLVAERLLGQRAAVITGFLAAVEPWHLHYSRLALRGGLGPPLLGAGLLLALAALEHKPARAWQRDRALPGLLLAGAALGLAALTYAPLRLVAPLLAVAVALSWWPALKARRYVALIAAGALVLMLIPSWSFGLSETGWQRFQDISLLSTAPSEPGNWLHMPLGFLSGWARHFSPRMLFHNGSSKGFWAEGLGALTPLEAPFLVVGLVCLARSAWIRRPLDTDGSTNSTNASRLILLGLLLSPVPSALTVPAPNPLRAIAMASFLTLVIAAGVEAVAKLLTRRWPGPAGKRRLAVMATVALALTTAPVFHGYFWLLPKRERAFWRAELPAAIVAAELQARRIEKREGRDKGTVLVGVSGTIPLVAPHVALTVPLDLRRVALATERGVYAASHLREHGRIERWIFLGRPLSASDARGSRETPRLFLVRADAVLPGGIRPLPASIVRDPQGRPVYLVAERAAAPRRP